MHVRIYSLEGEGPRDQDKALHITNHNSSYVTLLQLSDLVIFSRTLDTKVHGDQKNQRNLKLFSRN